MRLSEWRASAPGRETASAKVMAVVEPVLATFGLERDPDCWVAWGDDPNLRWTLLAASPAGLVTCHVRVSVPGEGPRASAKVTRWNRVQVGELAVETQGGHRLVTFQVESVVLRGADGDADRIGGFAMTVFAGIDGRTLPVPAPARTRRAAASGSPTKATGPGSAAGGTPRTTAGRRTDG